MNVRSIRARTPANVAPVIYFTIVTGASKAVSLPSIAIETAFVVGKGLGRRLGLVLGRSGGFQGLVQFGNHSRQEAGCALRSRS